MFRHKTKTGPNSSFVDRSACPAGEGWQITQRRRNLKGLSVGGRRRKKENFSFLFVFGGRGNFRTYVGHIGL